MLNEHLAHVFFCLSFLFHSAFKRQPNCSKKKLQLPYYWIAKQSVPETPLRILKESQKEDAPHVLHGCRNSGERRYQPWAVSMVTVHWEEWENDCKLRKQDWQAGGEQEWGESKMKGPKDNRKEKGCRYANGINLLF